MIIPSIDIEGGRAVKRVKGQRGIYIYMGDPVELAHKFRRAPLVHIVDLDGAEAGGPVNTAVIGEVSRILEGRCQLGGGLRSAEAVEAALYLCRYAVVGSLPFRNWPLFAQIAGKHRERLAVSLDYRAGKILIGGWREEAMSLDAAVELLSRAGPYAAVIVTAVEVEGTGGGVRAEVDVRTLRRLAPRVYYAGGVKNCHDVEQALRLGFDGVIVGYALYAGDLSQCIDW
ncbi:MULTISPECIES: HisA/HisF-related TIM barrel protein [Pyrobaculum]|uniref:1-(5-phosphoribosyl)-5-[(5-phosphoribosylamino)methylideneamino] imidazole-4-carboxamide isomerase n=2 Tax=Pyrobaculum arsenaticum TaxID=121277 RepID=A4WHB9_PYRAR|nr:HisA/HisF-related TIM barrel protein [Pyrobaculum arsenaticum]ABP49786.1 1-(5-phosphoribosyl)-5-[(5-phosphoribosylamino)methylideneamino] imidazole-4-carboxamide isomerase [Pyrobaculum arsenaticum DSM 13514]MCY0890779.1 HisA/HisF-related TIM barrel protein [Pyrobaculum arsenaticum]NYR15772.1 1-(5-phosphoribosyl)-5-((5-phosphoribosylamino)methylideneamino)imidazole-4-carboxamide isomerase [Pyrobaculum arsenaticum]